MYFLLKDFYLKFCVWALFLTYFLCVAFSFSGSLGWALIIRLWHEEHTVLLRT